MPAAARFQILDVVAAGANGAVVIAVDRARGEVVAAKVPRAYGALSPEALRRQRDEVRLLARLRHPHIVEVYELIEVEGRPVVLMEALEGTSLDALLRHGALPWAVAAQAVAIASAALDAAYLAPSDHPGSALHTVHRDIKPSNLFLTRDGTLKIIDFGLAKGQFEGRETVTQVRVLGSRAYIAPERMDGPSDSPKGDVYALGLTFFELLTGKALLLSLHPERHAAALQRGLENLSAAGHPPEIGALIAQMCAYKLEERPDHATNAAAAEALLGEARPSLAEIAARLVVPAIEARTLATPQSSPLWAEVLVLETVPLAEVSELDLQRAKGILAASQRPAWQFWRAAPSEAQVVWALRQFPGGDPIGRAWARVFAHHPSEAVRQAALALLTKHLAARAVSG